jgi:hypothetical protein
MPVPVTVDPTTRPVLLPTVMLVVPLVPVIVVVIPPLLQLVSD